MLYVITAFALVSLVVSVAGVAWHISLRAQVLDVKLALDRLQLAVKSTSEMKLRVEVDALAADLAKLSRRTRSEFGSVWQRISPVAERETGDPRQHPMPIGGNGSQLPIAGDEFDAMLALQKAEPPKLG